VRVYSNDQMTPLLPHIVKPTSTQVTNLRCGKASSKCSIDNSLDSFFAGMKFKILKNFVVKFVLFLLDVISRKKITESIFLQ
jgi:hypothetical protein